MGSGLRRDQYVSDPKVWTDGISKVKTKQMNLSFDFMVASISFGILLNEVPLLMQGNW